MSIKIYTKSRPLNPCDGIFPGGEVRVKFDTEKLERCVSVMAVIRNSDDIMTLLLAVDAIKRAGRELGALHLPYMPYAREDRVFSKGQPLGVAVMANLINGLGFRDVYVTDPHSDVTTALLNRCFVIDATQYFSSVIANFDADSFFLIAPDAGAEKKIAKHKYPYVVAHKVRDVLTGEITSTTIDIPAEFWGKTAIIVDDICDGGRTFTNLANVIKEQHPDMTIALFVTHGIFSQGLGIFDGLIDQVYTTNSLDDSFDGLATVRRLK